MILNIETMSVRSRKRSRHLEPLGGGSLILTDISVKYEEMDESVKRVSDALGKISDSGLFCEKTKRNLKYLIDESEVSKGEFRRDLRTKRRRERKRKHLSVITETKQDLGDMVFKVKKKGELSSEELVKEMMCMKLGKDWSLNKNMSESERKKITSNIMRLEKTIRRYRNYYGKNPLKWTPGERRTVSSIYDYLAIEYDKLGYEEGREKNKMIAKNLRDNPLNKLKRFSTPSAPRGCTLATCSKTFTKFADGD